MTTTSRQRGSHEPRPDPVPFNSHVLEVKSLHSPGHPRPSPHSPVASLSNSSSSQQRSRTRLLQQPYPTIAAFLLGTIFITWFPGLSILTRLVGTLTAPPPPALRHRYHQPILHGEWYSKQAVGSLPPWEPAAHARPWCTNESSLYDGSYFRTKEGEVMYEPASCKLPRLTGLQARTCLANKTLLFVGDSITRYQYVSLAHFLVHSLYPQRYADDPAFPSICLEKQFDSWPNYYSYTSALLSTPTPHQPQPPTSAAERCHCFRPTQQVGNHTYEHHDLHLAFDTPPAGAPPAAPTRSTVRLICNITLAWPSIHGAPIESLAHGVAHHAPDAIVLNVGAWFGYGPLLNYYNLSSAVSLFEPLFRPPVPPPGSPTPRLIWRTMSDGVLGQRVVQLSAVMDGLARYFGWEWMDVRRVTEAAARQGVGMRWDNLHFLPAMNDQWNDLLLHTLCSGR